MQIAKAVDHCDNDRIKTIKYLNKLKGKVCILAHRVPFVCVFPPPCADRERTMKTPKQILVDWDIRPLEA